MNADAVISQQIVRLAGEGRGDDAIARQFGCTRHQVRKVLAQNVVAPRLGLGQFKEIPVARVRVPDGRRPANLEKVSSIAESIGASGLINPITVREVGDGSTLILVAGRHRLEAFRELGRDSIPSFVMPSSTTAAEARMVEISENLHRAELTVQERSDQIAEWIELAKQRREATGPSDKLVQLAPVSRGGRGNEGGAREAERELGIEHTEAVRAVKIASITPEAKAAARAAGIDDNQSKLLKVAAEAPERQVETVHNLAGARGIMALRVEPNDSLDYFPTPPWATRALVERVLPHLGIPTESNGLGRVWEPACGEGHMSGVLAEYMSVHATDIHNHGPHLNAVRDFLDSSEATPEADWIITNPPFKNETAEKFTLRALDLARTGVAMFVRSQWVAEGINRYETIFSPTPPTLIAYFVERVPICKGKWDPDASSAMAYCWVVWIKDRGSVPTQVFWIPPGCRAALTKPDDRERFATPALPALCASPQTHAPVQQQRPEAALAAEPSPNNDGLVRRRGINPTPPN